MLENAIAKLYRRARDARRERRAKPYDAEASYNDMLVSSYRLALLLLDGLEATSALRLMDQRKIEEHTRLAGQARRHAADIRAGRRFRPTRAELYGISDEGAAADEAAEGPR